MGGMASAGVSAAVQTTMPITKAATATPMMGKRESTTASVAAGWLEQTADDVTFDEPLLPACRLAQGGGGESVEVTHSACGLRAHT